MQKNSSFRFSFFIFIFEGLFDYGENMSFGLVESFRLLYRDLIYKKFAVKGEEDFCFFLAR